MGALTNRLILAVLIAAPFGGCAIHDAAHKEAPVVGSADAAAGPAIPDEYEVVRGDSLYGIAFQYGLDYRELAAWNGIRAPYTIYPGQRIALHAPEGMSDVSATSPADPLPAAGPETRALEQAPDAGGVTEQPAVAEAPRSSDPESAVKATPAPAQPEPTVSPKPIPPPPPPGKLVWRWPTEGTVASTFSAGDSARQGVNIRGRAGQPVHAAAAGEVVYSGSGLIGYGELVIIKHNETFLSAYANNRQRVVDEGQRVAAGQRIAEMGEDSAGNAQLHFEIRRKGKPVDPLRLLPNR